MTSFSRVSVNNWRQFSDVNIDLNSKVTVITGSNGSGKTTLLNLVSRHFGWNWTFVSTPWMGKRTAKRIWSDIFQRGETSFDEKDMQSSSQRRKIGEIKYNNDARCELMTQTVTGPQYHPEYLGLQAVDGLHIPSHRPVATYHGIQNIPAEPITSAQQYQKYQSLLNNAFGAGRAENPGKIQKESLISLALMGEGNSHVPGNIAMKEAFEGFQEVLRRTLPKTLGFERIEIRMPEVVLVCRSGTFPMDAMSGGVSAIFSIVWQIFMFGHEKEEFTITIDEPENHLHPALQRNLLPSLANAFPNCKFIVATHSPFIVSSFPEAKIFALSPGRDQKITASLLSENDISGTPNELLRSIFDVDSILPIWVEDAVKKIIVETQDLPSEEKTTEIMRRLADLGLADSIVEYRGK
ncbi:AAA family ATPase [Phaeobacter sp. JH18-32]|uniref:AAA family ATPase n=1 Tax=Phaeobacter TaxID=302485 RepID=UPI003A83558F